MPDKEELKQVEEAPEKALLGKWVRRKSDGVEYEVMYLGHKCRDGRRALYGRTYVAYIDEVVEIQR